MKVVQTADEVLGLVMEHQMVMNEVNVATALSQVS